MVLGQWNRHMQKSDIGPLPYIINKSELKCILDLNVRATARKLLKENIGVNLIDLNLGNVFYF